MIEIGLTSNDIIVSVCMITYNHEAYIAQAIEGVLIQQTNFPVELVIGEDCSTDGTREVVCSYANRYPDKIRLLLPDRNHGVLQNFTTTLKACQGKYIALCEGDDFWTDPLKLQKQVDFLESHLEYSMCFHDVVKLYQDRSKPPSADSIYKLKSSYSLEDIIVCNFIRTVSVMYRSGLVDQLPDWCHTLAMGDWPRYILLAERGQIGYLKQTMAVYRIHSGGVWSSISAAKQLEGRIDMYDKLRFHLGRKYRRLIDAQLSLNYLELASVLTNVGNESKAKHLLMKSIMGSPINPYIHRIDQAALIAHLYMPILYWAVKKAWPSLGMRKT